MSSILFEVAVNCFALVDCNNFFVSCERLFNPSLEGKPVIVLSNNDGCVVARSQEAKDLNIKMGEPHFKIKALCERCNVKVYSSNFALYGDISQRVMAIVSSLAPEVEVYSIDEAFLRFPSISVEEVVAQCVIIRNTIKKWVGIPVSIGIAQTKTLAKVAGRKAKKDPSGLYSAVCADSRHALLDTLPIEEVWGVGAALKQRFNGFAIYTAQQFTEMDPSTVRRLFGVVGERMFWELRGMSCFPLDSTPVPKQSITCSRSFGKQVTDIHELAEALSTFVHAACIKLRAQQSAVQAFTVFLEAKANDFSPFRHRTGVTHVFLAPTSDTADVIAAARQCLQHLFQPGHIYKKCGVILLDLIQEASIAPDLFLPQRQPKRELLMQTVDTIHAVHGKNAIAFASMGVQGAWKARSDRRSVHDTTSWSALPVVHA